MAATLFRPNASSKKLAFDASTDSAQEIGTAWISGASPQVTPAGGFKASAFSAGETWEGLRDAGLLANRVPTTDSVSVFKDMAGASFAHESSAAPASAPVELSAGPPLDTLFPSQFYLRNTAAGELDLGLFRGTGSAWDETTGTGVHVGIIDTGIDYLHPELDGNYDKSRETVDASHLDSKDSHGTAVSGIIASERDGQGTVGIAYNSSITMMAAIPETLSDTRISIEDSFLSAVNFDVVNNSWSALEPWVDQAFNPDLFAEYTALDAISLNGRGGLGTVFVKAAGNCRIPSEHCEASEAPENSNFSYLNSHFATITVAAVNRDGTVTDFSTEGASVLVSAFGEAVVTTDPRGTAGGSADAYNYSFAGTSAAAPMVTGIAALMIDANPGLGYRDVGDILALTARHVGSPIGSGLSGSEHYAWGWNQGTQWNGQGMHFSEDYGFGLVDALAAVRLAESWTEQNTRANLTVRAATSTSFTPQYPIPDNDAAGFSVTFVMAGGLTVEQAQLNLGLSHSWTGDLMVTLRSPAGTVSELLRRNGGSADVPDYGPFDAMLTSNMFRGEGSGGVWTLTIADVMAGEVGALSAVEFFVLGSTSTNDTHVMTEEASDYALAGSMISDANGGIDTLNASAVFSGSRIDLSGVSLSTIDGTTFDVDGNIENAVGGDGNDTLIGTAGSNVLAGYRGADDLAGAAGNDTLDGGPGNDRMDGGLGNDKLSGGLGNDTYFVDSASDVVTEAAVLATEIDTVNSSVNWTLGANLEKLTLTGALAISGTGNALANTLTGNAAANILNGGLGIDTMIGGLGNDSYFVDVAGDVISETSVLATEVDTVNSAVTWTLGANLEKLTLTGAAVINGTGNTLANTLTGNAAANILNGGTGIDTMIGGLGNDTYWVDSASDLVSEASALATESDIVNSTVTWTLGANFERLTLLGTLPITGTGNALANSLTGNAAVNTLSSGAGDDALDGRAGNDTMIGGLGNDTYYVDSVSDVISETSALATEIDTVSSAVTWALGANLERLLLTGTLPVNAAGNTLANTLAGNIAANTLDGGLGADVLIGGLGNDTYVVDAITDVISEASTLATEIDLVKSAVTWTLGPNLEKLTLTGALAVNGTGNALANTLAGNAAANILNGGLGIDTMIGGLGNDSYVVDVAGDVISETSVLATEIDTVNSAVTWTLGANLEKLTLTGAAAINGTGNTLANTLTGNAAANILNGGLGNDTVIGGLGNDTYWVDSASDLVSESSVLATESDIVNSTVTWTLGANCERLTLLGALAIDGTGNALANSLTGNGAANKLNGDAGDDTLDGRVGNDTMTGGLGNDSYYVDSTLDLVIESSALATEIDLVNSTVEWTLGANCERLTLLGALAISGSGNELANTLTGNAVANILKGGLGNDLLLGGLGNDTLTGGAGLDYFRFTTAAHSTTNTDILSDFLAADDRIELDDAAFAGVGPVGQIAAGAFVIGAAALDATDRVIYNQATGKLYFDADGSGAVAAIQFASVTAGTVLTLADVWIV